MKLKMITLAVFVAGLGASFALASDGKHNDSGDDCNEAKIAGTIAPQNLAVTVDGASRRLGIASGAVVTVPLGATGQTIRVKIQTCATTTTSGTTTSVSYVVKKLEARVVQLQTTTTGTTTGTTARTTTGTTTGTTTRKHDDDEHGQHGDKHKGVTTTTATTTTTGH